MADKTIREEEIDLERLNLSSELQMRVDGFNQEHIDSLVEAIGADYESLPAIEVVHDKKSKDAGGLSTYYVWDGQHRVLAARKAGRETFRARVREGKLRDAMQLAAGANGSHGLRRTSADRRHAIELLLKDATWSKRSDRWIAKVVGCSNHVVAACRKRLQVGKCPPDEERIGVDGKSYKTERCTQEELAPELAAKLKNTAADTPAERARLAKIAKSDPDLARTVADVLHACEASSVEEAIDDNGTAPTDQAEEACSVLREMLYKTASAWRASCGFSATPALAASVLEQVADEWINYGWRNSCVRKA